MDHVETERLILRRWRSDDIDALAKVFAKPDVWWFPHERGLSGAADLAQHDVARIAFQFLGFEHRINPMGLQTFRPAH